MIRDDIKRCQHLGCTRAVGGDSDYCKQHRVRPTQSWQFLDAEQLRSLGLQLQRKAD